MSRDRRSPQQRLADREARMAMVAGAQPERRTIPTPGGYRPATVSVRIDGPAEAVDAAVQLHADMFGEAFQPGRRKPSRDTPGVVYQFNTLIVPVPRTGGEPQ